MYLEPIALFCSLVTSSVMYVTEVCVSVSIINSLINKYVITKGNDNNHCHHHICVG